MVRAYAKINLGLFILGKRDDGYHNIHTVFHRVDVSDTLQFSPSEELMVESSDPSVPGGEANICYRAAQLLQRHFHSPMGTAIRIQKSIPIGAGLGGGSSDAAAVLRSLPHFWEQTVEERKLAEMATTLGADVPFFLRSGSAVATGRGEELHYFNLDIPYTILLCHPNISVSTAWAYQQIRTASRESNCNLRDLVIQGMDDPQRLVRDLRNDFEQPVFRTHPEVAQIKSAILSGHAVYASMSGSGSAVYGLFERDGDAQAVASEFRSKGYRVFLTPPHFFPLD